ncbi:hypothetical protein SpCBS45565_g05269 [Spizellomyces sp. 'palustris']|nr:hypothetical protein SpCBS45565_g05269 [Spizellomyces sp. 'palustris']
MKSPLQVRYETRPDIIVIKDLPLEIKPDEILGIVGRTGSGKSTLVITLFRVIQPSGGRVEADHRDCALLGQQTLRSSLQMIRRRLPQFIATIRGNLDPQYICMSPIYYLYLHMFKDYVSSLATKVDALVVEGRGNLPIGQRQLDCVAKVIDEATAAVDAHVDKRIQPSTHYSNLIVSNAIAAFDRVLLLDEGSVVELDVIGSANAQVIRQKAKEAHQMLGL